MLGNNDYKWSISIDSNKLSMKVSTENGSFDEISYHWEMEPFYDCSSPCSLSTVSSLNLYHLYQFLLHQEPKAVVGYIDF